jgi:hypothetical protein
LLLLEHHPGGPGQLPSNRPDGNYAIGLGLFALIEALRQGFKTDRKMGRFGERP